MKYKPITSREFDRMAHQIMEYLAGNPKVAERFGSMAGIAFADLPESIVTWLTKGMEKVAEKIKNK